MKAVRSPSGGRDKRACPAHNVIPGEQGFAHFKAHMVGHVARCPECGEVRSADGNLFFIGQNHIGREIRIDPFAAPDRAGFGKIRHMPGPSGEAVAEGHNGRIRCLGERTGKGGVVDVAVRDKDGIDLCAADCGDQCLEVLRVIRPGVDHGKPVGADQKRIRAVQGHRRRVRGEYASQARFKLCHNTRFNI